MAKAKKKPAPKWRLYLVVAVDPFWNGKQYRGRFYKFGVTTKANALDRHPSYTEVLLSISVGCKRSGTWAESYIRQALISLGAMRRDEFSTEAVRCEAVTAEIMKTLVQGFGNALKYRKQFDCTGQFLYVTYATPESISKWKEESFYNEVVLWWDDERKADRDAADYAHRTVFWTMRLANAMREWFALPTRHTPEPMWA